MQLVSSAGLVPTSARSLPPFKLYRPASIAETLALLADADNPVLLAGGTDLVAGFNQGLCPAELISLAGIDSLGVIKPDPDTLTIGAGVTHHAGSSHPEVLARAPGFARAWSRIANPRIRFTATLGGNLMARRVRYEGALLLGAAQARLHFAGLDGAITLDPQELWGARMPDRALLTGISISTADLVWYHYERSMRPLITLATCLRRRAGGLHLACAVGTEYLHPAILTLDLAQADLAGVARAARAIAAQAFAQLPQGFADPVATYAYAKAAGSALLARQLAGAEHA